MNFLQNFLKENQIQLPNEILKACEDAFEIMRNSSDQAHNEAHIQRVFLNLGKFLKEQKDINRSEIDFEVLIPGIAWHDVWRTKKIPENVIRLLRDQIFDGIGSRNVFDKYAKKHLTAFPKVEEIKYVIQKHTHPLIFQPKTTEAWIMKDMDILEEWSIDRLEILEKFILSEKVPSPLKVRVGYFYFKYFMKNKTDKTFHFEWSKKEFARRKPAVINHVNNLILKYGHLVGISIDD